MTLIGGNLGSNDPWELSIAGLSRRVRRPFRVSLWPFTYFFRDSQTLELLVRRALPTLCGQAFIRIWDAGCANGAEPYTLAMLLAEEMSGFRLSQRADSGQRRRSAGRPRSLAAGIYTEQEISRIPPAAATAAISRRPTSRATCK